MTTLTVEVDTERDLPALEAILTRMGLEFEVENHDDIFAIARRMSGKLDLDENATNAFALGLKLFGETILKNRDNPLFAQIKPSMGEFMRALKGNVRSPGSEV